MQQEAEQRVQQMRERSRLLVSGGLPEIAELKRFSEEQSNGCDSLPVETAVSAGTFV